MQVAGLGAMRLIDQHQNALVVVEHLERFASLVGGAFFRGFGWRRDFRGAGDRAILILLGVAVLLDGGEYQAGTLATRQGFNAFDVGRYLRQLAAQRGGGGELVLQVFTVGDHDDLEAAQLRIGAHLAHQKHHGQALARALGMPDDAAALVALAMLKTSLPALHAGHRAVYRAVLLVAADRLDGLPTDLHEQHEMPDQIEQVGRGQHACHQALLLGEFGLAQLLGHGLLTAAAIRAYYCLPLGEMREAGANAAHSCFVVAAGDQQLHAGEQGLVALVLLDLEGGLALVTVAAQLIDGLGQRLRNGRALALHHH
ncbi:hypothetical protein FQZ97_770690 [compost metagenome]